MNLIVHVIEIVIIVFFADKAIISFSGVSWDPLNIKMDLRLFIRNFRLPRPLSRDFYELCHHSTDNISEIDKKITFSSCK